MKCVYCSYKIIESNHDYDIPSNVSASYRSAKQNLPVHWYLEYHSLQQLLGTAISPTRQKRVRLLRQCTGGPKAQQEQHQTVRLRRCGVCRSPSASAVAPPSPSPLKLPARTATGGSAAGHDWMRK